MVSSTRRAKCSLEEIFAAIAMARPAPYLALIASATSRHGSILRDETTTCAPCSAIRSTIARPIPREEPVTSATFPFRSNSDTVVPPPCYDVFCAPAYFSIRPAGKLKGSRAMTAINAVTDLTREGDIAVLTINSPPVNALSANVRDGLSAGIAQAAADPAVKAIVLICDGRTFIAGADISEFGKPPKGASLHDIQAAIEGGAKPVIAAIHGTAFGGGFELAQACHYRVAVPSAQFGQPEIKLGIIPGAGGTQRLPRLIGVEKALEANVSGNPFSAKLAHEWGAVDALVEEGKLREGALAFARKVIDTRMPLRKVRDLNDKIEA